MTDQEIEKKIRETQRKEKRLFFLYTLKNSAGHKTRGLSKNNSLILLALLKKYPIPGTTVVFYRVNKIDSDEQLLQLHPTYFRTEKPNQISVWFNHRERWGRIVFGDHIKMQLSETDRSQLQHHFMKSVKYNYILPGAEQLLKGLQKKLADAEQSV